MSERPSVLPPSVSPRLNAAIVGGGQACVAILRLVQDDALSHLRMAIQGVADVNPNRRGIRAAREQGVPLVTTDYRELYDIEGLDLIIEVTGKTEIRDDIERNRPREVAFFGHVAARLFWEVHQAQRAVIKERTAMRQQLEQEHPWLAQVFDSIPDEIVVLDLEHVVRDANAAFLKNNGLHIGDVQGCHCYEIDQKVRGECSVVEQDCPFNVAVRDKRPESVVRKHYDAEGRARYAAIVAGPVLGRDGDVVGVVEMTRNITGRIRLEQDLKAKEVQLEQILDYAPLAAYVKNRQGQYLQVNSAACDMFGTRRRDIIGKTDREVFDRALADQLRRGDGEVLEQGTHISFDMDVDLPAGRAFLSTTKFPLVDRGERVSAVCGLSKDYTAQKEVEAALALTQEYLQNIVDHSPVMIITTDLAANVVAFNQGAEAGLGYSADEVVGKPAAMFYRDSDERERLLRRIDRDGEVREYDTVLLKKDGSALPVSINLSELKDSAGRTIGTVGMSRDISQRKALLNQIIQSERLAAVGRLAAGVAHEINNPLAVIGEIGGYLTDLVEGIAETDHEGLINALQKWLPRLNAQVKRGQSVTHRMLRFGRKAEEADVTVVEVNAALDEMLPFVQKEAKLANVALERDYEEELPQVRVEEMQLQEIFLNLITNAIQALKAQGSGKIKLTTRYKNGKVRIRVKDNGPGIPEEVKDRLFDPFVTTKPPGQGTGLGLSICYGIVKRYDGEIRVESKPDEGAAFTVILPAWVEPVATPSPPAVESD
ncbi:MAG: PAS domain S-box protein [Deltaproteobacteria bacterium]|nr:PAS domain S-box protein [Deltaproteobacteria bacterium]